MKNFDVKKMLVVQSVILLFGTLFAWSKLIPQFANFNAIYGTLFRFVRDGRAIGDDVDGNRTVGATVGFFWLPWFLPHARKNALCLGLVELLGHLAALAQAPLV